MDVSSVALRLLVCHPIHGRNGQHVSFVQFELFGDHADLARAPTSGGQYRFVELSQWIEETC